MIFLVYATKKPRHKVLFVFADLVHYFKLFKNKKALNYILELLCFYIFLNGINPNYLFLKRHIYQLL